MAWSMFTGMNPVSRWFSHFNLMFSSLQLTLSLTLSLFPYKSYTHPVDSTVFLIYLLCNLLFSFPSKPPGKLLLLCSESVNVLPQSKNIPIFAFLLSLETYWPCIDYFGSSCLKTQTWKTIICFWEDKQENLFFLPNLSVFPTAERSLPSTVAWLIKRLHLYSSPLTHTIHMKGYIRLHLGSSDWMRIHLQRNTRGLLGFEGGQKSRSSLQSFEHLTDALLHKFGLCQVCVNIWNGWGGAGPQMVRPTYHWKRVINIHQGWAVINSVGWRRPGCCPKEHWWMQSAGCD